MTRNYHTETHYHMAPDMARGMGSYSHRPACWHSKSQGIHPAGINPQTCLKMPVTSFRNVSPWSSARVGNVLSLLGDSTPREWKHLPFCLWREGISQNASTKGKAGQVPRFKLGIITQPPHCRLFFSFFFFFKIYKGFWKPSRPVTFPFFVYFPLICYIIITHFKDILR